MDQASRFTVIGKSHVLSMYAGEKGKGGEGGE